MGFALVIVITLIAFVGAIVAVFYTVEPKRRRLEEMERKQADRGDQQREAQQKLDAQLERLNKEKDTVSQLHKEVESTAARIRSVRAELEGKAVSYKELLDENAILK